MTAPNTRELLAAYVPAMVARDVRRAGGQAPERTRRLHAALLLVDISGFTRLAERLCRRGPDGIEELSTTINACFSPLLDGIAAHGGEVLRFAGDALIAVWEVPDEAALATAAVRATACGLTLRGALVDSERLHGHTLGLRIGVSAGELLALHVGGQVQGGQRDLVVGGRAISGMGEAERLAPPGQVVLHESAYGLVFSGVTGSPLPGGFFRVHSVIDAPAATPAEPTASLDGDLATLGGYLPTGLLGRLTGAGAAWQAELRRVSVLFLHLADLDFSSLAVAEEVHAVFGAVQEVVVHAGGTINQFVVDDKGPVMVIAWGLPSGAHEDDAARAVRAALRIAATLETLGRPCSIGITTGRAYCGDRGNAARREYALIGDTVNVAARLMGAARGRVLCDEATATAAAGRLTFQPLAPLNPKGKSEPIQVFRPTGGAAPARSWSDQAMVGRTTEQAAVAARMRALAEGGPGGVITISGGAGMGKSLLMNAAREAAKAARVAVWSGECDAIENATPYYAWRGLLAAAMGAGPLGIVELRGYFATDDPLLPLLPLLALVLPVEVPATELTARLDGPARADGLHGVITAIVARAAAARPLVLLIEDVHWLDSASWELLRRVLREVPRVLAVLSMRKLESPLSRVQAQVLGGEDAVRFDLAVLSPADSEHLVCERLGVSALTPAISAFLTDRAEGHPFFTEQLACALRDSGLAVVADGVCGLAPTADLNALDFPATLEGVITARVDLLAPRSQLALKVASVIGRLFAQRTVRDLLPTERALEPSPMEIDELFAQISATELIRAEGPPRMTGRSSGCSATPSRRTWSTT